MKYRINGKTPHGGDYSEFIYLDNDGAEVDEKEATMFSVIEYKNDGTSVFDFRGFLDPKKHN